MASFVKGLYTQESGVSRRDFPKMIEALIQMSKHSDSIYEQPASVVVAPAKVIDDARVLRNFVGLASGESATDP